MNKAIFEVRLLPNVLGNIIGFSYNYFSVLAKIVSNNRYKTLVEILNNFLIHHRQGNLIKT